MKKRNLNILLVIIGVVALLVSCIFVANKKTKYSEEKSVGDVSQYYDYSELTRVPEIYSYSNLFLYPETEVVLIKKPTWHGSTFEPTTVNINGKTFYNFGNAESDGFDGGEVVILFTNTAHDPDGNFMDAVIRIGDVNKWGLLADGRAGLLFYNTWSVMNSQGPHERGYHNVPKQLGDPISISLFSYVADVQFSLTYCKHGTVNRSTGDCTVETRITNVQAFINDFDILSYGLGTEEKIFGGSEGFAPTIGSSKIYYNKNANASSDYVMKEVDNGLAIDTLVGGRTDGIYYQGSTYVLTSGLNGTFSFRYGGADAGIEYMFLSPTPGETPLPTKSKSPSTDTYYVGDSLTYTITQSVPASSSNDLIDFSDPFPNLASARYEQFKIVDTFDDCFTINQSGINVIDSNGNNVTSYFNITVSGQTVTATAKTNSSTGLVNDSFYNKTYKLNIPVTISSFVSKTTVDNKAYVTYKNKGRVAVTNATNSVTINIRYKLVVHHYIVEVATNDNDDTLTPTSWTTNTVPTSCTSQDSNTLVYNSSYNTTQCSNLHYYYRLRIIKDGKTGNETLPNGVVSADKINNRGEIVINYYYERKPAKVLTNHLVEGTRVQVPGCESTREKSLYGLSYLTTSCNKTGYTLVGVDSSYDPASGTVTRDTMSVIYLYRPAAATITIHHCKAGTTCSNSSPANQLHADDVYTDYIYGDTYPTPKHSLPSYYAPSQLTNSAYEWDRVLPSNYQGVITSSPIEITYHYQERKGDYVVHHYLQGTESDNPPTLLCNDEEHHNLAYGTHYETSPCSELFDRYNQAVCTGASQVAPGNASGNISAPMTEITYCYSHKLSNVTTHHYMQKHDGTKTTTRVHADDTQTGLYYMNTYDTSPYSSVDLRSDSSDPYIFKNRYEYKDVHDGDATTQQITRDSYTVNYYYEPKATSLVVHHYKEGTTDELCASIVDNDAYYDKTINYDKCNNLSDNNYRFKRAYTNVNDNTIVVNDSNVSGYINQSSIEIIFEYERKPASYTVHHYLDEAYIPDGMTAPVKVYDDEVISETSYGEVYETSSKDTAILYEQYRKMYRYTGNVVGNPSGIISSDNMVITYYYEPFPVDVITHHIDKRNRGSIVHEPDVQHLYYGSTVRYETNYYETQDLIAPTYQNNYSYTGVHTGDPISGVINVPKESNEYHIYYEYDLDQASYVVHHYKWDSTTNTATTIQVSPDIIRTENFGGAYHTSKIESSGLSGEFKNNYQYFKVVSDDPDATVTQSTGETSGIFNKDRIEITYYYVVKKATITAHYYVDGTNTRVHQDIRETNKDFGTTYVTQKLEPGELEGDYKDNYVYSRMDQTHDPATGNVGKDEIDVIYYYVRNPIILTTRHYIKGTSIDVSTANCPETNEELDRRSTYSKSKCTNLPNGYQYDNVRSTDSNTSLNQSAGTASGTITQSTTITFEYSLQGIGLTVQYYDIDTGERFEDYDKFISKNYGESVFEKPINITDYEFVSVEVDTGDNTNQEYQITANTGVVNGTIRKDTTIKYYYRKVLNLIVHHYKNGTTTPVSVCEDEHNRVRYNTTYEKNPCANQLRLGQYRYVAVESTDTTTNIDSFTGKATGTIKNNIVITYYYDIPTVVPQPSKTGTTLVTERNDVFTYQLSYVADIKHYVGPATYKLVDRLPYPLAEGDSRIDLAGGEYDASSKTIVWIVNEDVNTGRNDSYIKQINKEISVVYRDIPVTVYNVTNVFDTTTELDGYTEKTTNELTTDFKLYTLTVTHRMESTDEEIASCPREVTNNMNYGDTYSTIPCQTLGTEYTLKSIKKVVGLNKVNGDASGTITEDLELIYYYDYTKYNVTIKHLDVDTNEELVSTTVNNVSYGTPYEENKITKDRYQFDSLYVSDDSANKEDDHVSGTVTKDTEITFYYKKYQTITIKHIDIDTNEVLSEETRDVPYRSSYEEHKKDIDKYLFADVLSDDLEAVIEGDKVSGIFEKDINITYRYKKQLDLVTHHYKKGTTESICQTENEVLPYNTSYEKAKCSDEYLEKYIYAYVESSDTESQINDPAGVVTGTIKDDITIDFYYELTEINQDVEKTGPELLHSRSKAFNYTITDQVSLKDYRGDATITVVDKLEYEIDTTKSSIGDGVYDQDNLTITWIIPWNGINTNGVANSTVTKNVTIDFTIYYKDVPKTLEVLTNRATVNVQTAKVNDSETNYLDTSLEPFDLTVHHYKEGTTQELCPTTSELIDEDETYKKSICDLDEYDYIEVKKNGTKISGNPETVEEPITGDTTLDFIYRKKDSTLETVLTKKGPDDIQEIYEEAEYEIHYEGHVIDYRGNGTITLTDTLPYRIDTNKSDLDGGEYDGEYKIVWKVNWNDIDTYNGKNDTIKLDKKIKVVFLDVNVDRTVMTNVAEAETVLSDKRDLVSATKESDINLSGSIIVHHYINGTTDRLFDDDEETGLVHDKYHCEPHELEGYVIVQRPEKEDVEFTLGTQELSYYYDKEKYVITVNVVDGDGTASGTEEVKYGSNSTEGNIVIIPGTYYEIDTIVVDGVALEITNPDMMVLENFKNVKENHVVNVLFSEKPIEVPITGRKTKLIISAIVLIIISTLFVIKSNFVKKLFKKSL